MKKWITEETAVYEIGNVYLGMMAINDTKESTPKFNILTRNG